MNKENQIVGYIVIVFLAAAVGMIAGIWLANGQTDKNESAWREAARPIFEARHVAQMADSATPRELRAALDCNSALTYQERSKLVRNQTTTRIIIARSDEEWVRLN